MVASVRPGVTKREGTRDCCMMCGLCEGRVLLLCCRSCCCCADCVTVTV